MLPTQVQLPRPAPEADATLIRVPADSLTATEGAGAAVPGEAQAAA
jgi:hypothetical protein